MKSKRIAVLGSTGSIGRSTLEVCKHLGFPITALAARSSIDLLEEQAKEFHPSLIAVFEEEKALELQRRLPHIQVLSGIKGLVEVGKFSANDLVVSALVGTIGILPTIAALNAGKDVALANKEVLVSAGSFVTSLAKEKGARLLPIDSEHSALFQCLDGKDPKSIRRLILTASGGPFFRHTLDQLQTISVEDALKHPTWRMGVKNTIDSSTMMNKGLEVIEAHWLFGIPKDRIDVVIHPQSTIHSMVEFTDGSILAQLSNNDMRLPIQYALTHPERAPSIVPFFDFTLSQRLEFFPVDMTKFRCLPLAYDALERGKSAPCFLNAANEVLVQRFAKQEISWLDIQRKLESLFLRHSLREVDKVEEILEVDDLAREEALRS